MAGCCAGPQGSVAPSSYPLANLPNVTVVRGRGRLTGGGRTALPFRYRKFYHIRAGNARGRGVKTNFNHCKCAILRRKTGQNWLKTLERRDLFAIFDIDPNIREPFFDLEERNDT